MKLTYEQQRTNAERIADEELKERVLKGLAVLQERFGDDWVERIDCDTLRLSSATSCVLGQVYYDDWNEEYWRSEPGEQPSDPYSYGVHNLGLSDPWDYGFDSSLGASYSVLDAAWRQILCEQE